MWIKGLEFRKDIDDEEEEEDPVNQGMGKAIRNVLEREGMISKPEGKWMRTMSEEEEQEEVWDRDEEDQEEDEEDLREEWKRKKRIRILLDLLTSLRNVVKGQARKQPDEIMNRFQVRKINRVLEEIRELVKGRGLDDLMELIEEPREVEREGKTVVEGMSYSDAEILLEYYNSVIWFTQAEIKG